MLFRNHEFYGQKASVHMRHCVAQDGTVLCFGDCRIFVFLHVLRYTTDVPCNLKCFPRNFSCFFYPSPLQKKISKAGIICSWDQTTCQCCYPS